MSEKLAPLLTTDARYIGIKGGRGGAKSWFVVDHKILAEHVRDPDRITVCFREVQKSLEDSSKRLLEQRILDHGLEDYFDVKSTQIRSKRGRGVILFRGLSDQTAQSIKSLEGIDLAWLEEAQDISKRSIKILLPTVRKPGSRVIATWNPVNETDPIDALFCAKDKLPNSIVVEANYYDNPWCTEELRALAEQAMASDPEEYAHIWEGRYLTQSKARVFTNFQVEKFEAPKDAIFRYGLDFGFSPDPTVLVRGFIVGNRLYIDHEAYETELEIEDTPAMLLTVPGADTFTITAASDRPERIKSLRRAGFNAVPAVRGNNSVQDGVSFLKGYQIIVHPRCVNVIRELRTYSRKVDPLTGEVLPILEDKHNHTIDAMRYLVEQVRRTAAGKTPRSEPIPVAHSWGGGRRG